MSNNLTTEMLATALQRLEALQLGETAPLESEETRRRAREVAEAALQAIAVCVKYTLASDGESVVEGLGTFVLQNGNVGFVPESDVLQYALLKHQDEASQQQAFREAFVKSLALAWRILPALIRSEEMTVAAPVDAAAEERLIAAIFGDAAPSRFDAVVTKLLSGIIRDLNSLARKIHDLETRKASSWYKAVV